MLNYQFNFVMLNFNWTVSFTVTQSIWNNHSVTCI